MKNTSKTFSQGKLPDNEYAFRNAVYLSPLDCENYPQSKLGSTYVKIKNFVLQLLPLANLQTG